MGGLPNLLPLRHRSRRNRYLLIMSFDPSVGKINVLSFSSLVFWIARDIGVQIRGRSFPSYPNCSLRPVIAQDSFTESHQPIRATRPLRSVLDCFGDVGEDLS